MNCRRHGSKPTIALWMLIAVADVALLAAAAGPVILLLIAVATVTVAGAYLAMRLLARNTDAESEVAVQPVRVTTTGRTRRRA